MGCQVATVRMAIPLTTSLTTFEAIMLIIAGIFVIVSVSLLTISLYWLWLRSGKKQDMDKTKNSVKWINICCMMSAVGCSISVFLLYYHAFTQNILIFDAANNILYTLVDVFTFLCKIFLYFIVALRLFITFNDSYLKISKIWFLVLSILYLIGIVGFGNIVHAIITDSEYDKRLKHVTPFAIILSIDVVMLFCVNLYLFNSRLWRFINDMSDDDDNDNGISMNDKQQQLLAVMVRVTVLSFIAILCTTIMYLFIFSAVLFVPINRDTENAWVIFLILQ